MTNLIPRRMEQIGEHEAIPRDDFTELNRNRPREHGAVIGEAVKFSPLAARVHPLGQLVKKAIVEIAAGERRVERARVDAFGRLEKTLHTLNYLDDGAQRRATLTQLNRGEGRHSLARALFHGRRGELRQRYREGQEDQLGALGLVVNIVALWNTLYMEAALGQLRREGHPVRAGDVARLSPLAFEHINLLGRYSFTVPDAVIRGELRPLRDPKRDDA